MASDKALLYALGGLAAAEYTGVTNFSGGDGEGSPSGGGGFPGLPNITLPDVAAPEAPSLDLSGFEFPEAPSYDVPTFESPEFEAPTIEVPTFEIPELPGTDDDGNGNGGDGSGTTVPTDNRGYFRDEYEGPGSGFLEPIAEGSNIGKNTVGDVGKFGRENPFFVGGTAIGSISPDPVTTGAGAVIGGATEVVADSITGGTPLGFQSPVDLFTGNRGPGITRNKDTNVIDAVKNLGGNGGGDSGGGGSDEPRDDPISTAFRNLGGNGGDSGGGSSPSDSPGSMVGGNVTESVEKEVNKRTPDLGRVEQKQEELLKGFNP